MSYVSAFVILLGLIPEPENSASKDTYVYVIGLGIAKFLSTEVIISCIPISTVYNYLFSEAIARATDYLVKLLDFNKLIGELLVFSIV